MSKSLDKLAILLIVWLMLGGKLPDLVSPVVQPLKATAATYVFEKNETVVPPPVLAALDQLNSQGIVATVFEDDTTDGTEEVPEQYKVPLAAAREAGLPALVVTADKVVLRLVKDPRTEKQVMEAASP